MLPRWTRFCRPDKAQPPSGNGPDIWHFVERFRSPGVGRNVFITGAVNGTREAAALPLSIPAAPRGNRCCALRSPPACLTAAGSTRLTRPILGARPSGASASAVQNCSRQFCPCLGSPLSAIHGVQTLSFTLRFADFSGDTTPSLPYRKKSNAGVAVGSLL